MKSRTLFAAIAALVLLCALSIQPAAAQSGVITGPGSTAQCYVLIDALPATYACNYRASVACVDGSAGYVGNVSTFEPLQYPLAIQLRRLPSYTPAGVLTLPQLPQITGAHVDVWMNGVGGSWVLSAPFWGQECTPPAPPGQTWRDERVCRLTGRLCGN